MADSQTLTSLEERIARQESRAAIADLIHRYAFNIRNGTPAENASLFTADATFETRDGDPGDLDAAITRFRLQGRDAIIAHISKQPDPPIKICPSISNLLIGISGGTAHASCLMSARLFPGGQQIHGEYRDSFQLDDGIWRFRSRIYIIFRAA